MMALTAMVADRALWDEAFAWYGEGGSGNLFFQQQMSMLNASATMEQLASVVRLLHFYAACDGFLLFSD